MDQQTLLNELLKIREALNALEVRGERNASLIVYCYNKCSDLMNAIGVNDSPIPEEAEGYDHTAVS